MAVNFTLGVPASRTKSGIQHQLLSAKAVTCVDQAATASWVEVDFGAYPTPSTTRGFLVRILADVAIRIGAGSAAPSHVGTTIPAGGEYIVVLDTDENLYVKTA